MRVSRFEARGALFSSFSIPVPPITIPVAFAAPSIQTTSFRAPSSPESGPNVTVSFSGLPPAIAAAIAAAPRNARPLGPQIALPPYTPAPNVGDPGEGIETVRVEKYEFTELVEKYAPLPVEHVAEIDEVPRAFDTRKVAKTAVRFAPWIGGAALVLTFAIGYLMFDGDHARMTTVGATAPAAASGAGDAAKTAVTGAAAKTDPAKTGDAESAARSDDTKPDAAKTGDAKAAGDEKSDAAKANASKSDVKVEPVAKLVRGKIYINSNKPAQIFLDGKSASATTPRQLTVRPGVHKVTLWETASGKTQTQMVEVQADKVVTVSKKV